MKNRVIRVLMAVLMVATVGWGPITHVAINKQAGSHLGQAFLMGGHAPDMIALYHVTTGSRRYDYAHNPFGGAERPLFGQELVETVNRSRSWGRYGEADKRFGYGWAGHQLADCFAHGESGFSTTKQTFTHLPAWLKSSLNHGATELMVDAIVLSDFFGGNVSLFVVCETELIHEAAVRFYNSGEKRSIDRDQIISCGGVTRLTTCWEDWLQTSIYLAELAAAQPWFNDARIFYADYKTYFDDATGAVKELLGRLAPFSSEVAYAAEDEEDGAGPPDAAYYRFVMKVSEEAKRIGKGEITRESLKKALAKVTREDLAAGRSEETKVWAKFMEELYLKDNKSYGQAIKNVERYAAERPEGGPNFLAWLMVGVAVVLAGFGIGWLIKVIKGGDRYG